MLLNNFSGFTRGVATGCYAFDGSAAAFSSSGVGIFATNVASYYTVQQAGLYIDVGFGDTLPQKTDYKLADSNIVDTPILTYVSCVLLNILPYIRAFTTVYRNDTANDVVVKEIGMVTKSNYTNNLARNMLLSRNVLQTPVTMHPGDTYSFTLTIEI